MNTVAVMLLFLLLLTTPGLAAELRQEYLASGSVPCDGGARYLEWHNTSGMAVYVHRTRITVATTNYPGALVYASTAMYIQRGDRYDDIGFAATNGPPVGEVENFGVHWLAVAPHESIWLYYACVNWSDLPNLSMWTTGFYWFSTIAP